eukprot:TRINITY_DN13465_c0_g1_i1.p1 TRINITY_DN13465_c0_g1~~TRINITY_DN13465_c0_g1_i1.p1  ORF type:complete len:127 (-),score=28.77 TRINITY_DN13465_c0_g1_i1:130-510(-)
MSKVVKKTYSVEEIAKHNKKEDLWLIISGKVYDVSGWDGADGHPGGIEILVTKGGEDATQEFEDQGHSDDAIAMLPKYYIGDVKGYKPKAKPAPKPVTPPSSGGVSPVLIVVAIAVVAAGAYWWFA